MSLTDAEAKALVAVLSLAENSQVWTSPMVGEEMHRWRDDLYESITEVREFLKRNGVLTLHELTQKLSPAAPSFLVGDEPSKGDDEA